MSIQPNCFNEIQQACFKNAVLKFDSISLLQTLRTGSPNAVSLGMGDTVLHLYVRGYASGKFKDIIPEDILNHKPHINPFIRNKEGLTASTLLKVLLAHQSINYQKDQLYQTLISYEKCFLENRLCLKPNLMKYRCEQRERER